jgi:hypothetical protein
MNIDCTLDDFAITGFSGYTKPFGTKKPVNESMSAREEMDDLAMPFELQRPHLIAEDSATSEIQANSVFEFTEPALSLTLGAPAYGGCQIVVINSSDADCSVIAADDKTIAVQSKSSLRMEAGSG